MILRPAICIPTYNNHDAIEQVVLDVLQQTTHPVVVIDDGSKPALKGLCLASQLSQHSDRLSLLVHSENQGKGVAIQTGFKHCLKMGYTHALMIDGEGQHLAEQ